MPSGVRSDRHERQSRSIHENQIRPLLRHDAGTTDVDARGLQRAVGHLVGAHDGDVSSGLQLALIAGDVGADHGVLADDDLPASASISEKALNLSCTCSARASVACATSRGVNFPELKPAVSSATPNRHSSFASARNRLFIIIPMCIPGYRRSNGKDGGLTYLSYTIH